MKPSLLVLELWGLGDLCMASSFLTAASARFDVTLVAKPTALPLRDRLWPDIEVVPFTAPWTAFRGKYHLHRWNWSELRKLTGRLRSRPFDHAVSVRADPRDHILMALSGARKRIGFPRVGSGALLSDSLIPDPALPHRAHRWQQLAARLKLDLGPATKSAGAPRPGAKTILIHSGAAQPTRVWPPERFAALVGKLRGEGHDVAVACDEAQRQSWQDAGEKTVATPGSIPELIRWLEPGRAFIGNDSGPGHLAATLGIPTFTVFGPVIPEHYHPLHPAAAWMEGKPCPHKPCFDSCRFPKPHCILDVGEAEVGTAVRTFLARLPAG